jgi:hypothetical protein
MASVKWACAKCGAEANGHGKGDCLESGRCIGFICECDHETDESHGVSFADVCHNARWCYHCGWEGSFPRRPKGLQAWEKKALEAGWTPTEARRKELGL